jgi:hypothetical protein
MMSQADACSKCMEQPCYCPVTSQANACSYCMGSVFFLFCLRYTFTPATLTEIKITSMCVVLPKAAKASAATAVVADSFMCGFAEKFINVNTSLESMYTR